MNDLNMKPLSRKELVSINGGDKLSKDIVKAFAFVLGEIDDFFEAHAEQYAAKAKVGAAR